MHRQVGDMHRIHLGDLPWCSTIPAGWWVALRAEIDGRYLAALSSKVWGVVTGNEFLRGESTCQVLRCCYRYQQRSGFTIAESCSGYYHFPTNSDAGL